MELRLTKFITSVERVTDIYNQDYGNPILLTMPHPQHVEGAVGETGLIAQKFAIVAAVREPAYLGLPINAIWIVLDPHSTYYRSALKLKSHTAPDESGVAGAITDEKYGASWIRITRYQNLWDEEQVSGGQGAPGPKGLRGDLGIKNVGVWNQATAYKAGEGTQHNGWSWLAVRDNQSAEPAENSQDWLPLARRGLTSGSTEIDYDYIVEKVKEGLGWTTPTPTQA